MLILCSATVAHAIPITVNLGPPRFRVALDQNDQFIVPTMAPVNELNGQTLSLDYTFNDHQFVRLYSDTSRGFDVAANLLCFGDGTINEPSFQAWTVDQNGQRNSGIWSISGGSIVTSGPTEVGLLLGFVFPVLGTPQNRFDFYGLHMDVTLPTSTDFDVIGSNFYFSPDGFGRVKNQFGVGPFGVPDTGSAVGLFLVGLAVLSLFGRKNAFYTARKRLEGAS